VGGVGGGGGLVTRLPNTSIPRGGVVKKFLSKTVKHGPLFKASFCNLSTKVHQEAQTLLRWFARGVRNDILSATALVLFLGMERPFLYALEVWGSFSKSMSKQRSISNSTKTEKKRGGNTRSFGTAKVAGGTGGGKTLLDTWGDRKGRIV